MKLPQKMLAVICCSGICLGASTASEAAELSPEDWVKLMALNYVRAGKTVDDAKSRLQQVFNSSDVDGGGITDKDETFKLSKATASARARVIAAWVTQDLDGDGEVSRTEIEVHFSQTARRPLKSGGVTLTPTPEQVAQILGKLTAKALEPDSDGDGVITFAEISAAASEKAGASRNRRSNRFGSVPMSMDLDGNGSVSLSEFTQSVDRTLNAIDTDGDGKYSQQEHAALNDEARQLRRKEQEQRQVRDLERNRREVAQRCVLPAPAAGAKIVLLGAYEGLALSSAALDAENSTVTVANVRIDPGTERLYVMLTSGTPMIWRFSGAVERVSQVAVNSRHRGPKKMPLAGIVGVPKDRVHMIRSADCLPPFHDAQKIAAVKANGMATLTLGRPADFLIAQYGINTISLPSGVYDKTTAYEGAVELPKSGLPGQFWRELRRFNPGGVVQIDPSTVVTPQGAKDMDVLPQEAGLAQLVANGALKPLGSTKEFMILKQTRLPAGLSGAHSVRFILRSGVPAPIGRYQSYCIWDADTGKRISGGRICR